MTRQIAAPTAQPDPHLGPAGTNRRLDRPPARGDRPADPGLQARAGARARRREPRAVAAADFDDEIDLRAEDDALIAAELDGRPRPSTRRRHRTRTRPTRTRTTERPARRRGAAAAARGTARGRRKAGSSPLEATFDHGEEGYGLWLDPAVQDDPVYAEYWAGHRPVEVTIEEDQIVIRRAGGEDDDEE